MSSSAGIISLVTVSSNVNENNVELITNIRFITIYVFLILEHISTIPQQWPELFLLSVKICKHVVAGLTALSVLAMGIADMIVMLRVSVLWGRQRHVLSLLATAFILTYSATIACAVLAASQLVGWYSPILQMAFDFLVLTMTSLNSCSRPRKAATPLSTALYRDGLTFFLVIAGLRALNLFMTLFSQVYLVGICISWPISAIVLSRLIFHLQQVEKTTTPDNSVCCDDPIDEVIESKESVVLDISRRGRDTTTEPITTLHMWEIMEVQSTQSHNRSISQGSVSLLETRSGGCGAREM
ncbi:hypothetical protein Clacol_010044 [Clathrus columnatus]|uniref:Uncharacterized protein n=1 Tax=Clathrus columnatus TaxID=1419009 RepID=A0AAV5AM99_9AGAM|nr:hypothetical protein Clacol_010044 [Clathrus columnatus]